MLDSHRPTNGASDCRCAGPLAGIGSLAPASRFLARIVPLFAAGSLMAVLGGCGDGPDRHRPSSAGGTDMGSDLSFEPGPAPVEPPRYGGELNVGTVYVTLSALSWDTTDWNWKQNHDTGMLYEQLFVADLDQAAVRGGDQRFVSEAYLSAETIRGEVAASWEWEDPLTLVIEVRRGMVFPENPGVMEGAGTGRP